MKDENYDKIFKQYRKKVNEMLDWEESNKESEVWSFYNNVLHYHFFEGDGNKDWECSVQTNLYSFLKDAIYSSGDDSLEFVLGLQSFLSNCILDDSYITVKYFKIWSDPENAFKIDVNKLEPCPKEDWKSFPVARWASDADLYASTDIKLLEDALEHICSREKARYEKLNKLGL